MPLTATDPRAAVDLRMGTSGVAAAEPVTVPQRFRSTVAQFGSDPALYLKRPGPGQTAEDVEWQVWTWQLYYDHSMAFAKALMHLRVDMYEVVNIIGFNSPEWFISNMGAILSGGIAAGIYTTNSPEACQYVSDHSRAPVVVLDGNKQLAKYTGISHELSQLKALVVWGEDVDPELARQCACTVYSWADFVSLGQYINDAEVDRRANAVGPGNCCSLIYTSGTTGPPKAVMISHDNITWTATAVASVALAEIGFNHTDSIISYLPLSHIAAQINDVHGPMYVGARTYFAQPDALKGSLGKTLREVRPGMFFAVPRVWEKIMEGMKAVAAKTTGAKALIAAWAKGCGAGKNRLAQYGSGGGAPCGYGCANALILSKIKEALGLDRCRGCFTAAAPISLETLTYFASLDIPVYEVFGQSECTGPHTVSTPAAWRMGYCGRPLPGTVSRSVPETGELIYSGRHIFMGYMYNPEKTAETIDDEGFLHSGDVAEFDGNDQPDVPAPSGFMRITGRIKELIITAGGENIPPVLIEQEMKAAMPGLANVMVIGDKRKFLSMLVTLATVADADGVPTGELTGPSLLASQRMGSSATTVEEAMDDPLWAQYIADGMAAANAKTTSRAQVVQKFTLLPRDFSERTGELTPTLKLKRGPTAVRHAEAIEAMYA